MALGVESEFYIGMNKPKDDSDNKKPVKQTFSPKQSKIYCITVMPNTLLSIDRDTERWLEEEKN